MLPVSHLVGSTNQPRHIGAILLAAGSGSRLGNRPKCLLELDGVPLICRQLAALTQVGVAELVVVLGQHADRIAPVLENLPVHIARNMDPNAGQSASLHLGLQALSRQADTVLVVLADQPLIDAQDLRDLMAAYANRVADIQVVQPHVDGLPGNPVMFSSDVSAAILRDETSAGCRGWQAARPSQVLRWETANTHYRFDVDCPEDIDAFALLTGQRLLWPPDLANASCATIVAP
jgi:molybdenum cofactor cytidylyltransferase